MDNISELKKFKELLDSGVITEEEFQAKKCELLGMSEHESITSDTPSNKDSTSLPSKKNLSKNAKIIIGIISIVIIAFALFFGISKITSVMKENEMRKASTDAISDILNSYGLNDFEVTSSSFSGTDVLCADFENLSDEEKYNLIKETTRLDDITVKGEKISLSCDFYVNSRDYYYYISPLWAAQPSNNYSCGGVYKYDGNRYCVYKEK